MSSELLLRNLSRHPLRKKVIFEFHDDEYLPVVIENDNSYMGCDGEVLSEKAKRVLHSVHEEWAPIWAIDGNISSGSGT